MKLYRKELRDGIAYNHIRTDRFKDGYLSLHFILPLSRETVAYNALLPNVLHRGCRLYPTQADVGRRLEELYGSDLAIRNMKRGESQIITFTTNMLDDTYRLPGDDTDIFGGVLEVLCALLFDPLVDGEGNFRPDYVETERLGRIDAIRAAVNNKRRYAIKRCTELMCADEVFGLSSEGCLEDYESIDPALLRAAYRRLIEEAQIEAFYIGKRAPEEVEPRLTAVLSSLPRASHITIPTTEVIRRAEQVRNFEESAPIVQGNLVMGFRTGTTVTDADYLAFPLFSEVFGASPSSKLFMNVREKKSLCYYCTSLGDLTKGIMYVNAGIENKNRDEAVAEILLQLEKTARGEIEDGELLCAKQSLFNSYRALADSPSGIESWYVGRVLSGRELLSAEEVMEQMKEISVEDIAAIARKITHDCTYFLRGTAVPDGEEEDDEE